VQAANGTLSADDRMGVQKEVDQLKNEIDRVGNQTSFNGTKLLDGSSGGFSFQVGADANQTIAITSLTDARAAKLGTSSYSEASGTAVTLDPATPTDLSAIAAAPGGTASTTDISVGGFKINGIEIDASTMSTADNTAVTSSEYKEFMSKTVDAINAKASETGVTASLEIDNSGATPTATIKMFGTKSSASTDGSIEVTAGSNTALTGLEVGIDGVDKSDATHGLAQSQTGFADIDVTSISGANKGLTMLDGAINAVNGMRADLGAVQNRFSSTVTNLQATSENLSASRSRIQDADFASETASMTRGQILQQAGTAMLAQANSLPNNVLSLLRG
jgi:flagellin